MTRYVRRLGFAFVYTMIESEGEIYITSSSASEEELNNGVQVPREPARMHPNQHAALRQRVRERADNVDAYGFFNLLTGPELLERVEWLLPEHRERVFPPTETLAMFLAQALSPDGSCRQAVDDAAVKRLIAGLAPHSTSTSAYCQARARLPLPMISTLAREAGGVVAEGAAGWWHWRGRRVRLVDGATMTLADTEENQAEYPQPKSQKAGLGFPICRMVVLLCLATGALLNAATGPCEGKGSDEQTLLRSILDTLQRGEVLIADAFYATYFLLCELQRRGVDGVFEQYGARKRSTDFRLGQSLGVRDHLIVLAKPKKPDWMSQSAYDQVPATLTVREFQAGGKIMVATFLCPKQAPKRLLKVLYRSRWNVELDLRNTNRSVTLFLRLLRGPSLLPGRGVLFTHLYGSMGDLSSGPDPRDQSRAGVPISPRRSSRSVMCRHA